MLWLCIFVLVFCSALGQTIQANDDTFSITYNVPTCLNVIQNDIITNSTYLIASSNGVQGGWSILNAKFHLATSTGVIFEAEDYNTINEPGTSADLTATSWINTTDYANTAGGALRSAPNLDESGGDTSYGRMVSYKIAFTSTGSYVMWARGRSCVSCTSGVCDCVDPSQDNTLHALTYLPNGTLDFITQGTGAPIRGFDTNSPYDWQWDRCDAKFLNVTATELFPPNLKTFFIAVREDGFVADRLALIKEPSPDLTDDWGATVGNASSVRINCTANEVLYIPPTGFIGQDIVTYNISNGVANSSASLFVYVGVPIPSSSTTPSVTPTPSRSASPSSNPSVTPSTSVSSSSSITPTVSPSMTPSVASVSPATSSPSAEVVSVTPSPSPDKDVDSHNAGTSNSMAIYVASAVVASALLGIGIVVAVVLKKKSKKRRDDDADMEMRRIPSSLEDKWEIDYNELTIGNQIGSGAFGNVFKARWRNCDCVVKQLNSSNQDVQSVAKFLKEANIVKNLKNHENICTIFGVCTNPEYPICIVMEYVAGGSLQNLIYERKLEMTGPLLMQFAKNICSGMSHIHKENLLHCDLACRNLLISPQGFSKYTLKITDFGLARISDKGFYNAKEEAKFPIRWTAPEVLTTYKVSRASDVWSFGVVLWEMIEAKVPWYDKNNTEVMDLVCTQHQYPPKPKATFEYPTDETYAIMVQCWQLDSNTRPSFNDLFQKFENLERIWGYNQEKDSDACSDNSSVNSIGVNDSYVKIRAVANFSIESDVTYGNRETN